MYATSKEHWNQQGRSSFELYRRTLDIDAFMLIARHSRRFLLLKLHHSVDHMLVAFSGLTGTAFLENLVEMWAKPKIETMFNAMFAFFGLGEDVAYSKRLQIFKPLLISLKPRSGSRLINEVQARCRCSKFVVFVGACDDFYDDFRITMK